MKSAGIDSVVLTLTATEIAPFWKSSVTVNNVEKTTEEPQETPATDMVSSSQRPFIPASFFAPSPPPHRFQPNAREEWINQADPAPNNHVDKKHDDDCLEPGLMCELPKEWKDMYDEWNSNTHLILVQPLEEYWGFFTKLNDATLGVVNKLSIDLR